MSQLTDLTARSVLSPRRVLRWVYTGRLMLATAIFVAAAVVWEAAEAHDTFIATLALLLTTPADAHLILGHLTPAEYACATPDGRPATLDFARERVARLVCADAEQLAVAEIDAIAAFLHGEQVRQIEAAVQRVSARLDSDPAVVPLGTGAFLAREAANRLGRAAVELPWSSAERDASPAAALAELVARRPRPRC